jgi:TatD DNase family protein
MFAMQLTDTHCHLDFDAFDADRSQVIERARAVGVQWIIDPGVDLSSSRAAIRLSETHAGVFAAAGVHPNDALSWDNHTLPELRQMATHPRVVAVGEIGLDYYRDRAPKDVQQRIFRQQLDLAAELGLPVIIHCRNATADVLRILAEKRASTLKGVLHSFSGDQAAAEQALALGFWIGITGPVTFQNAADLQLLVSRLPLENLLIETDAPFLTPHPRRGQRNEPAHVHFVAEKIAALKGLPLQVVAEATTANAARLFDWSKTA